MNKKIKINFVDFHQNFDIENNLFISLMKEDFDITIDDNPDFLFFSVFGETYKKFNCKKIFYTGEPIKPDLTQCDYSMSFDFNDSSKHIRLPVFSVWPITEKNTKDKNKEIYSNSYYRLIDKKVDDSLWDRKFCNFVVSNPNNKIRNDFFLNLNKYKKVDSAGKYLNNIGGCIFNKLEFQSNYKFSICFENSEYIGYTTEKIVNAMLANSIPIYWGNPLVYKDFNKESFINYYDFNNEKELIEYIIYLDNNKDEYLKILKKPWLENNKIQEQYSKNYIKEFLKKILNNADF